MSHPEAPIDSRRLVSVRALTVAQKKRQAAYVSAEGAIAGKLHAFVQSGSTRHLEDIGSIVRVQGNKLDAATIDTVAARLGVLGAWRAQWEGNRGE